MKTIVLPMREKPAILKLGKEEKQIRGQGQTLCLANTTILIVLKKKESNSVLSNRQETENNYT